MGSLCNCTGPDISGIPVCVHVDPELPVCGVHACAALPSEVQHRTILRLPSDCGGGSVAPSKLNHRHHWQLCRCVDTPAALSTRKKFRTVNDLIICD